MTLVNAHPPRRGLLRLARLGMLGAASLMLVAACDYSVTGSGGTGPGPAGAPSAGSGSGGLIPTPSGGSNATTGGPATSGGPESRTANSPVGPTMMVPTPGSGAIGPGGGSGPGTGAGESGPAVPKNESGTPLTAGSAPAVATSQAIAPGGNIPVTPVETAVMPTPTPTATPAQ
jgi:hypothetical protein